MQLGRDQEMQKIVRTQSFLLLQSQKVFVMMEAGRTGLLGRYRSHLRCRMDIIVFLVREVARRIPGHE